MAATTSSAFTMADRRKRIATYGKSSRPPSTFTWNTDAPSPERPRKQTGPSGGLLKKPSTSLRAINAPASGRANLATSSTQDIFEVPPDDELPPALSPAPAPPKKRVEKQPVLVDQWDVPSSSDDATTQTRRAGKALRPLRKPAPNRQALPVPKSQPISEQMMNISSDDPLAPIESNAKVPQHVRTEMQIQTQVAKKPNEEGKTVSRAASSAPPAAALRDKRKKPLLTSKRPVAKPQVERDIFDVPSEDEFTLQPSPRRPRPIFRRAKTPTVTRATDARVSTEPMESDDSNASKKRKRQDSRQLMASKEPDTAETLAVPQRNKKYQKREDSIPLGQEMNKRIQSGTATALEPEYIPISKPKRTRVRTVAGSAVPSVARGRSSPARLHGMLATASLPKLSNPLSADEKLETTSLEDETMYDIPDLATPLARSTDAPESESVTPRQRQISTNLNDFAEATTPGMPSIRRLQLTDRKPAVLPLASLTRFSSDIPQTNHSRKTRLVDSLRQAPSSDEEDNDSEDESEEDVISVRDKSEQASVDVNEDDGMDADQRPQAQSQPSQNAYHVAPSSRVTYAKQRSYLEESNLEDDLLLSMDLDEVFGLGDSSRNKNEPNSDEEDDPASQVRGMHELKRLGQNQKFQLEAQTAIDDIGDKAGLGLSARRSAMLDFCTRMADRKYLDQLFDSALGHQFIKSISSKGEVIFDFAATVTVAFVLDSNPGPLVLDEIFGSDILATFIRLLDLDADVSRIARERKTNLSKVGRESVADLRNLVQESSIWPQDKPEKVSPQIVAMRALDLLVLALRKAGRTGALIDHNVICKLLDIAAGPSGRFGTPNMTPQDLLTLNITFSVLEPVSMSTERQPTWSNEVLRRLAETVPVFFGASGPSPIKLVLRLCMNLTNNRPKVCEIFADPSFVRPLVESISHGFARLTNELEEEERIEVMEGLVFSLGLMMNLTEFSDKARASIVEGGDELVDALATIFLEGSERAAQADSLGEAHASVTVGYLTVLLGNICLNGLVRRKICSRLPGRKMDLILEKIREFVRYNERVDRETSHFEGEEGRETWQNFTARMLQVVDRLEKADT